MLRAKHIVNQKTGECRHELTTTAVINDVRKIFEMADSMVGGGDPSGFEAQHAYIKHLRHVVLARLRDAASPSAPPPFTTPAYEGRDDDMSDTYYWGF